MREVGSEKFRKRNLYEVNLGTYIRLRNTCIYAVPVYRLPSKEVHSPLLLFLINLDKKEALILWSKNKRGLEGVYV